MTNDKIRNIIFDIGNVLFDYDPVYIVDQLLPKVKDKTFYLNNLFFSDQWDLLDRGDLSSKQLLRDLKRKLSLDNEQLSNFDYLLQNFPKHLHLNEAMKEIFDACLSRYRVYILSNFQYPAFNVLLEEHPFLNNANGIVISAKVMMKKPEIGIYHYLLTQHRIIPQESIFIDDRPENIQTAKRLLINSVLHTDVNKTKKALEKAKINLK